MKEVAAFGTHSLLCSRKEKSSSCGCTVKPYIVYSSVFHGKNKSNNCSNYNNGNEVCSDISQRRKIFQTNVDSEHPHVTKNAPEWSLFEMYCEDE